LQPLKVLGVYRLPIFSNNAIEADRSILEDSLARLQSISPRDLHVEMAEESELESVTGKYSLVLTMAQSEAALQAQEKSLRSSPIWNSPASIRNCYRKTMSQKLINLGVNYVPFQLIPTDGSVKAVFEPGQSYWLKRSDFHAIADEDVCLAESEQEALARLDLFRQRGVKEVIIQKHIAGPIYKFYGVEGKFFRPIRLRAPAGWVETANVRELERIATQSALALGVKIYGGDAILDEEGKFHLIDLNDWPSFRLCRPEAADAIASLALDFLEAASRPQQSTAHPELATSSL
jgi:glutathione synthase/RimK-type ligase-like ATP-grasp enzyme